MKVNKCNLFLLFILCLLLQSLSNTQAENILFYFGIAPTYSHRISIWPLVTSLADKGHNVTFCSILHPKPDHVHPKVNEHFPKEFENDLTKFGIAAANFPNFIPLRLKYGRFGLQFFTSTVFHRSYKICDQFLSTNETQNWIKNTHFDLIIIDASFSECGYALAYKFNAKTILFSTRSVFSYWHDIFGFPAETNSISEQHLSFPYPMAFGARIISTLMPLIHYFIVTWTYFPKLDTLFKEKFNQPNFPSVLDLMKNTSLIFTNLHFSEEFARSLPPLIVPVGGLHVKTDNQVNSYIGVPKEILHFMDESGPSGFIYISFGSKAEISKTPKAFQEIFFSAINNTKIKFLLKWEDDKRPADMPLNVMISQWMPQQQILAHPNIKAFITHSGLIGLIESINAAVPVIMLPIFADQDYNSFRFEHHGRGIRLEIATLTGPALEKAIQEILTNSVYKKNMLKARKLYMDRPTSPLQTAIWWTEYVLRNNDFSSLKPLAINQTWYERRLLDVWAFIDGFILVLLLIILYLLKKLIILLFSLKLTFLPLQKCLKPVPKLKMS